MEDLPEIRGKTLACHCAPQPCHADILLRLANANVGGGSTEPGPGPTEEPNPTPHRDPESGTAREDW